MWRFIAGLSAVRDTEWADWRKSKLCRMCLWQYRSVYSAIINVCCRNKINFISNTSICGDETRTVVELKRTIKVQIVQKLKNEPRPKFTGSYKKKRRVGIRTYFLKETSRLGFAQKFKKITSWTKNIFRLSQSLRVLIKKEYSVNETSAPRLVDSIKRSLDQLLKIFSRKSPPCLFPRPNEKWKIPEFKNLDSFIFLSEKKCPVDLQGTATTVSHLSSESVPRYMF